jgi:pimeloyl-ACP methyl ester carboxylesterase
LQNNRPRILLVPWLTEIEWLIKPQLEQWADVASFDGPGIGGEPPVESYGSAAVAERGLQELDRLGWSRCVVVGDEFGSSAATALAGGRPQAVAGLAMGHARLSNSLDGERPALNREILSALVHLGRTEPRMYVRQMFKLTHGELERGGYGDQLVESYLERVPQDLVVEAADGLVADGAGIAATLEALDAPLFLASHSHCLMFTPEGYSDAVDAFPGARTASYEDKPSVSGAFAEELRSFCADMSW